MCATRMVPLEKCILNTKERKFIEPPDTSLAPGLLIELEKWFSPTQAQKVLTDKGWRARGNRAHVDLQCPKKGVPFCDLSLEDGASLLLSLRIAGAMVSVLASHTDHPKEDEDQGSPSPRRRAYHRSIQFF